MRRCLALLLVLVAVAHATVDPCKRQPFRGRCPSVEGAPPKRSQFVLRYYSRNGECVSYPYGHCASDSTEPQLYRYKEECEDACITPPPANLGSPKDGFDQTYGTVSPSKESTKVEEAPTKTFTITADVSTTTETPTTTETLTTSEASTTTEAPSTIEVTTTTEAPTTTEVKTTVEVKTTAEPTTTTAAPTTVEITTTSEVTTTESPTTLSTTQSTVSITTEATETSDATEKATENLQKAEVTTESSESTSESSTTVEATTVTSTTTTTTTKAPVIEKTVERKIEKISVLQRGETVTPTTSFEEVLPTTAVPRTDCERRRAAAASSKIRGGFVPVCKGNGDFEPLQCELDGRQCFCVDQSGIEIANSRTHNGVKPDCAKIEAAVRPRVQECTGEFERGPCASHMERWHYVEAEQKCKQFSYSGCGGNGNNYETERDCIGRCAPLNAAPRCAKGEPLESKQGSFINCAKTECPSGYKCNVGQQISVCCPDTEKTVGLQQSTTVGDVCRLDKERGPCDKYELRFYFNGETKECKYFFWGGCEGNGNNFETIESCESTCGITKNRGTTRHPTPRTTQGFRINQNNERTESTAPAVTTSTPTPTTHHHVETTTTARPTTRTTRRPTTTPANIPPVQTADDDDVVVSNRNNNFQGHPVAPVSPAVLLEGSDLSDAAADANRCAHPRDSGTCGGQFVRWFWDDDRKTCDVFTYSGCQGNGNNFASREECFAICHKENAPDFANVCHHDVDAGECNGVFQRFAFDSESGECRPFTYGGCGGNGNNFATITECRSRCQAAVRKPLVVATNLCDHNIDVGECTGVFVRFGFDRESNDCRQFTYGGCGGNGNNFASLLECRNVCVKKACPQVTATCDMSRCQIVEDQNGCPFCSCSPVKQPLPPVPSHCTQVNENSCHEPCLLINNRRGCQECVCPKTTQATNAPQPPPTQMTQQPIFGNPPGHQTGRAPGSDVSVGPPASATRIAPPSPNSIVRAHDVKTVSSQQKTSELESSRPFIPPTLNAELNEKCLQAVEVGPCKNFVDRWFFSSDDGSCRPFKYGGCAGNRNHFFTQKECEIHCARFLRSLSNKNSANSHVHDSLPSLKNWVYHVEATHRPFTDQSLLTTPQPLEATVRPITDSILHSSPEFNHRIVSSLPQAHRHPTTVQRFELPFELPSRVRAHATTNVESGTHEGLQAFPETYEISRPLNPSDRKQHAASTHENSLGIPTVQQTHQSHSSRTVHQEQQIPQGHITDHQNHRNFVRPTTTNHQELERLNQLSNHLNLNNPEQLQTRERTPEDRRSSHANPAVQLRPQNGSFVPGNAHHIPRRQEGANLESVHDPIPLHRPAQNTYTMSHVDNYDPSRNPNLEGLSPPVDPTYFTYNSQNLGVRRQFAVNSIPFERKLPLSIPRPAVRTSEHNHEQHQTNEPERRQVAFRESQNNLANNAPPQAEHRENLIPFQQPHPSPAVETPIRTPPQFVPMRPKHIRLEDTSSNDNQVHKTPVVHPTETRRPVNLPRQQQSPSNIPRNATNHGVRSSDTFQRSQEKPEFGNNRTLTPIANTIPGIRINKTHTIDLTIHAPGSSSVRSEEFQLRSKEFQKNVQPFMEVARNVFENYRNGTPISKSAFMHEQKQFPSNAPPLVVPDQRSRKLHELSDSVDLPLFMLPPPNTSPITSQSSNNTTSDFPNSTTTRKASLARNTSLNALHSAPNIPFDNFPAAMQRANRTLQALWSSESNPASVSNNRLSTVVTPTKTKLSKTTNLSTTDRQIQAIIRDMLTEQPDDFSSEEGVDFDSDVLQSVNRRRPIAAGVSQHHEPVPLPVDNYKSPDPVLRGNQPSPYGKKEKVALPVLQGSTLESMAPGQSVSNHPNIITTQGYKITSTTTASSTAPITTTTPSTTRASTTTTTSVPSTESARTQSPSSTSASVSISSSTSPVTADVTTTTSTTTEAPAKTVSVSTTTTTTTTQAPTTTTEIHKVQLPADKEILESSKFSNEKVLKVVDEEQTFLETAVHADEKNDEHKSALKKIEIGMKHRSSFTSTTALPKATQPTEQPQLNESNVKNVLQADAVVTSEPSTVAVTTTSPVTTRAARLSSTTSGTTASESSSSSTTTEAPTSTVSLSSSTSTSSSPSSTTVQSTSTAAPTTTQSDTSTDSDEIAAPSAIPVSAAGVSQFEPVHEEDVLNPNLGLGREPIPTGPVGIGRNLEPLDLDGLEEPTTVLPSSKKPVAFTVAAPPAPAQLNPNVHNLRSEDFDAKVICALAPETGPCTNYLQRWFFNAQSLQCEQFSFGSCGGNQNNFGDRTTCELKCMIALGSVTSQVPERCSYDKDAGFGQGYNVKWYFNMKNLRCEQFVYEGQGGNSNQFETLSDCERFCTPQPKISTAGKVAALPSTTTTTTTAAPSTTEATSVATTTVEITTTTEAAEKKLPVEKDLLPVAPASHSLRPLPEEPLNVSIDESDNIESIDNNDDYDSSEDDENDLLPVPTKITTQPTPPAGLPEFTKTDEVKAPAHAAKTVTQEEVEAEKLVEKKDKNYKAEPIAVQPEETAQENLPRVGPSPPMKVDYQTGQINPVISGIKTFPEGRIPVDKTEFDATSEASQNLPSCPNGLQEMRYADGRPVMCLPGKNQCPDKSVCYFNGIDFFCCPNIDDPYDKHVFGGYDGEETKHGYKIFGPLRVRRLMDEVPLRTKRQTSIDKAFNTAPVSFSIDSVIAPLRFDAEKPRSISRAARMRKPSPPQHGNPMCMLPLAKGDCQEAHLRYYYDRESDSCRLFHYSGCQGNANNFGSLEDCQRLCVLSGQPLVRNTPAPVAKEETSLAPVGQCPVGSPLGGNAPVLCGSSTDSIGCPDGYYCRAGPPDVCCPGPNPTETKKEIRFSPETPKAHNPRGFLNEVLHSTPIFMCPDASDPLMAENGKPRVCGSGFDGMQMCPKGYYCAIDNESGSRLCCSLLGNAERIPNQQVNAPYFGRRSSNPGEIIERGTLPSDSEKPSTVPAVDFSAIDAVADNTKSSISIDASEEEYEDEDETPEHLLLKPLSRHEKLQQSAAAESPKASNIESEVVNIDMPTESPTMVEEVSIPKFNPMDQSICHVKPTEGRACREDEKAPKTNLQYFYSAKDNRCKLYFYRGCGGNENRFERKADCEALCVGKL